MAKQLRVDAAELTDIGRRRTTNQDNLARRIPEDLQELERNGALFVVADGMGGHAAGEVASTVAVQTICSAYYEGQSNDVLHNLAQSIKSANEAILSIARQHTENTGMGTTLVAAVICQGILYVANIGDSRAYLVRKGKIRQVTEDHSWVAEQVRAGVLTEEQAKTHVHRNVITRSLGTQPNVIADVFVERAREGDILILCSDGLHGYIDDQTMSQIVLTMDTAAAAQKLIALANEAGGPDNITVSIIHVNEIPEAPQEMLEKLQLLSDQPRPTRPVPIVATSLPRAAPPSKPSLTPPEPLIETDPLPEIAAHVPTSSARRSLAVALRLGAVAALVVIFTAIWYITIGPFAQAQHVATIVSQTVTQTQHDITTLSDPKQQPAHVLSQLAADQSAIARVRKLNVTADQRKQLDKALASMGPLVHDTLTAYNAMAHIVPLVNTNAALNAINCPASLHQILSTPGSSVIVAGLTTNHDFVQLTFANNQYTCGTTYQKDVVAMQATGTQVDLLVVPANGSAPFIQNGPIGVPAPVVPPVSTTPTPSPAGTPTPTPSPTPAPAVPTLTLAAGTQPIGFASNGATIAVLVRAANTNSVMIFSGPTFDGSKGTPLALNHGVRSLSFGNNGILYLLLDDGTLATYAPGLPGPHIVGDLQINPTLPIGAPEQFTLATPIPTVTSANAVTTVTLANVGTGPVPDTHTTTAYGAMQRDDTTPTPSPTVVPTPLPTATPTPIPLTGPSTALATAKTIVASVEQVPHVVVLDNAGHRVIIMQSLGLDLSLIQQYADSSQLDHVSDATVTSDGHFLFLLTDKGIVQITLP